MFWQESFGGTTTGCFLFGCTTSFYFHIDSTTATFPLGQPFCDAADGTRALCSCAASDPVAGCNIAQGPGIFADVLAQDLPSAAATIQGASYPPAQSPTALLIRANDREPTPVLFGDGLRCVGLTGLVRIAATTAANGISIHAFSHGAGPGTFHYQIWFRNRTPSFCVSTGPGAGAFNLSNGQSLTW